MIKNTYKSTNPNPDTAIRAGKRRGGKSWNEIEAAFKYIKETGRPVFFLDAEDEFYDKGMVDVYFDIGELLTEGKFKGQFDKSDEARLKKANGAKYQTQRKNVPGWTVSEEGKNIGGKKSRTELARTYWNGLLHANKPCVYRIVLKTLNRSKSAYTGSMLRNAKQEAINILAFVLKDCKIILEEANSYYRHGRLPDEFFAFLTNTGKRGVDTTFTYQAIRNPSKDLWSLVRSLHLHYTIDRVADRDVRDKVGSDKYWLIRIGELIIRQYHDSTITVRDEIIEARATGKKMQGILSKHGSKGKRIKIDVVFFSLKIDFESEKIIGNFSKEIFQWACDEYLQETPGKADVKKEMSRKLKGKKIFRYEEDARKHLIETKYMKVLR